MKKYTTKPIDFTGCHPVIAEALKRGEAIKCRVWDVTGIGGGVGFVVGYSASNVNPYRCDNIGSSIYRHAEPIPIKTHRIMPPEQAISVLLAEGWEFNTSGQLVGPDQTTLLCWPPCIIEEVEDNE